MKNSTLIVIALAITIAISSCKDNKNDVCSPATLTLTIEGSEGAKSKATGTPSNEENHINSLDIMVFQGSGGDAILDERKYVTIENTSGASSFEVTVPITQGAERSVHVVANTDEAHFSHITKLSDIWNLPTKRALDVVHTGVNLAMSGSTNFAATNENVTVSVELQYVPSVVYFAFEAPTLGGKISTFVPQAVYLLNVKEKSDYFTDPAAVEPASLSANVTDFAHGLADHATHAAGSDYYPANSVHVEGLNFAGDLTTMTHDNNFFYIIENHNVDHPTTVVLEALVNGDTYYYPIVINGDQNTSPAAVHTKAGDGSFKVKRGQQYKITSKINDFGTTNPFNKIEAAAVTITVTPAEWPIDANFIDQEFN